MINEKTSVRLLEHPWQWLVEQPPGVAILLLLLLAALVTMAYLFWSINGGSPPSEEEKLEKEIKLAKLRKELAETEDWLQANGHGTSRPNSN